MAMLNNQRVIDVTNKNWHLLAPIIISGDISVSFVGLFLLLQPSLYTYGKKDKFRSSASWKTYRKWIALFLIHLKNGEPIFFNDRIPGFL